MEESPFEARRRTLGRGVGILLLLCLGLAGLGSAAPVNAAADDATTEAFAAAAGAESASGERVVPTAIPGIVAAARAATFGARQLARTPAFRQQVSEVTRNAGLFRQVAGFFGFGAAAATSPAGGPTDVERIFDN